ncbi:hypothetical protein B0189_10895, partial [Moraxella cuniculi]
MNRLCYRVIFNKNLGQLIVVSEKTRSQGKSSQTTKTSRSLVFSVAAGTGFGLKTLSLSLLLSLGLVAHANTP